MARNLKDDNERERRVDLVGSYVLETGDSMRKTAAFFTENYFPISYVTVRDYCDRYVKIHALELEKMRERIKANREKTVTEENVRKRVINNAKLFLAGFTIEEIAEATDVSYWTIYRDLKVRYKSIDADEYEKAILPKLRENSSSFGKGVKE